jgi:flavin-dependent dehydrogenase
MVLDEILVDAAADAGAEVRQRFSVQDLLWDGTTVTGVRGRAADGATVTEKARIVIGADGRNSFVARSVQAPVYGAEPSLTCAYYTYWSGVEMAGAELYPRPDRMIVAAPTNDDQVVSIVFWPHADFARVRADLEGHFLRALGLAPSLNEHLRTGTRTDRFRGTGQLPNFYRRPYGDGWALVGDAGYHKDPILALGITDAFRDAELLSEAVDAAFSGRRELTPARSDYERRRNEISAPGFESTLQFARLQPPDEDMQQLLAALRGDQRQTDRFFGTVVGTVHPSEFFTPENLASITGAAVAPARAA